MRENNEILQTHPHRRYLSAPGNFAWVVVPIRPICGCYCFPHRCPLGWKFGLGVSSLLRSPLPGHPSHLTRLQSSLPWPIQFHPPFWGVSPFRLSLLYTFDGGLPDVPIHLPNSTRARCLSFSPDARLSPIDSTVPPHTEPYLLYLLVFSHTK